jgi:hypothetical protein
MTSQHPKENISIHSLKSLHRNGNFTPLGVIVVLIFIFLLVLYIVTIYFIVRKTSTAYKIYELIISPDEPVLFTSTTPIREIRVYPSFESQEPSLKYLTSTFYLDNISSVSDKLLKKYEKSNDGANGQLLVYSQNIYVEEGVFIFFSFSQNQLGLQSITTDSKIKIRVYSDDFEHIVMK